MSVVILPRGLVHKNSRYKTITATGAGFHERQITRIARIGGGLRSYFAIENFGWCLFLKMFDDHRRFSGNKDLLAKFFNSEISGLADKFLMEIATDPVIKVTVQDNPPSR